MSASIITSGGAGIDGSAIDNDAESGFADERVERVGGDIFRCRRVAMRSQSGWYHRGLIRK